VLEDDKPISSYNIQAGAFVVALPQKVRCLACLHASLRGDIATRAKRPRGKLSLTYVVCVQAKKTTAANPAPATPATAASAAAATPGSSAAPAADSPAAASAAPTDPPAAAGSSSGGDGLLSGPALDAKVAEMAGMGFPEEQVRAAMRAAFNQPERAMQYLLEGIPEGAGAPSGASGSSSTPAAAGSSSGGSGGPLDTLRSIPGFNQLRRAVQADPSQLPQIIGLLSQRSPAIGQWIASNQSAFVDFMNEEVDEDEDGDVELPGGAEGIPGLPPGFNPQLLGALIANLPQEALGTMAQSMGVPPDQLKMLGQALAAGGGAGGRAPPGSTIVRLTQEEAAAVDRLAELGVSRQAALEAYLACDKKEDLAANFLMQNMGFD